MVQELGNEVVEVMFTQNNKVIQALDLHGLDGSFRIGVHVGRTGANRHDLNPGRLEHGIKPAAAELAVVIPDQMSDLKPVVFSLHDEVSSLLNHPPIRGMLRGRADDYSPRFQMDKQDQEQF